MILSIVSIIINILFFVVLNLDIYTDRMYLPDNLSRERQVSPLYRLNMNDMNWLLYLQIFLAAVSVITSILFLAGVRNNVVKIVQIIATIASAVIFVLIMILTGNTHAKYA